MKQILLLFKQNKNPRKKSWIAMTIFISIFTILEPLIDLAIQFTTACTKSIGSTRAHRAFLRWSIAQAGRAGIPRQSSPVLVWSKTSTAVIGSWNLNYFRIYFPMQMWFFSDLGMVWYVWDMWYAIMRCILKGFYHASNGSAENWSWSFTPSFTLAVK